MVIKRARSLERVGMVFSGGPAPGSNAVISSSATSFLDDKIEVVGFLEGFSNLQRYDHQPDSAGRKGTPPGARRNTA